MKDNFAEIFEKVRPKRPRQQLREKILSAVAEVTKTPPKRESPTLTDRVWSSRPIRYAACAIVVITILFNIFFVAPQRNALRELCSDKTATEIESAEDESIRELLAELNGDRIYLGLIVSEKFNRRSTDRDQYFNLRKETQDLLNGKDFL